MPPKLQLNILEVTMTSVCRGLNPRLAEQLAKAGFGFQYLNLALA